MFDLRYHVASLAAVFLALVIGIVVGVGISGRGILEESERRLLNEEIARLQAQVERESRRTEEQEAAQAFVAGAYGAVMHERLRGVRVAVLFVGSVDRVLADAIEDTIRDAGGELVRLRALDLPVDADVLLARVAAIEEVVGEFGEDDVAALGRALGEEFVSGGETPLWTVLTSPLVEQRRGRDDVPADAVVVARTASPQQGESARFVFGLLTGVEGFVPAVGVERADPPEGPPALEVFRRAGLSTVAGVDSRVGRVALAVLLAGGDPGDYGAAEGADAMLPAIPPVEPEPAEGDT
jgi:hypothetical protein